LPVRLTGAKTVNRRTVFQNDYRHAGQQWRIHQMLQERMGGAEWRGL
jgi:hypothetical protein